MSIVFGRRTLLTLALSVAGTFLLSAKNPPPTTGHSIVNPTYQRTKLPNGDWKEETYTFGKGQMLDPTEKDSSLTSLTFPEIGRILAESLWLENYVPTKSATDTDLLIVVSWGKTMPDRDFLSKLSIDGMSDVMSKISQLQTDIAVRDSSLTTEQIADGSAQSGPSDVEKSQFSSAADELTTMMIMQSMSDSSRRQGNNRNARLLGYAPALSDAYKDALPVGISRSRLEDLISEIETPRYFIILQAYDFQKLWKEDKKELLWMTRFSIRAHGRKFDSELANMTSAASSLFGRESGKIKRNLRPGRIKMGELEVLGIEEEAKEE